MRAAFVKRPGRVRIDEVPEPAPGPGETLVRIDLCGVCGSDILDAKAWARDWKRFGHEMTGTVARVGRAEGPVREGDRVAIALSAPCGACAGCAAGNPRRCSGLLLANQGGFAEYVTVRHESLLHRLPEALPAETACFAEPLSVVLDAFEAARLAPGDRILAVGGGFLAATALLAAAARGVRVEGVLTRGVGGATSAAMKHTGGEVFTWRTRLGRTAGPPADFEARLSVAAERLVVLHTAPARYIRLYADALPFDSTIVNIGLAASDRENRLSLDASMMLFRRLQVVSGFPVPCMFMPEALDMLSAHLPRFSSLPTRKAELDELPAIIRGAARRDGKILVKP